MLALTGNSFNGVSFDNQLHWEYSDFPFHDDAVTENNTFTKCRFQDLTFEIISCTFRQCEINWACNNCDGVKIRNTNFENCSFKNSMYLDIKDSVQLLKCKLDNAICIFSFEGENASINFNGSSVNNATFHIGRDDSRTDNDILNQLRVEGGAIWENDSPPKIERVESTSDTLIFPKSVGFDNAMISEYIDIQDLENIMLDE